MSVKYRSIIDVRSADNTSRPIVEVLRYYTSLRLLFSIILHLLMSTCLLSVVYGRHSTQIVSCHDGLGLGLSILIQSHYYWLFLHPSKSKRRDV